MSSPLAALKLGRATAESSPYIVRTFDRLLDSGKALLNQTFFESNVAFLKRAGIVGLVVSAALGLLFAVTVAIKADALSPLLYGLAWALCALLVLYVAEQFVGSGDTLLKSAPSELSSLAFLNSFALLNLVGGWLFLFGYVFLAIHEESLRYLWIALGGFVLCEYLATIAMNPGLANVTIRPRIGPGEEALGILSFFLKALLRLVPIAFGAGVVIGTLSMTFQYVNFLLDDWSPAVALAAGFESADWILTAGLLPLTGYVTFLVSHVLIAVVRSILAVPSKLDELRVESSARTEIPEVHHD